MPLRKRIREFSQYNGNYPSYWDYLFLINRGDCTGGAIFVCINKDRIDFLFSTYFEKYIYSISDINIIDNEEILIIESDKFILSLNKKNAIQIIEFKNDVDMHV